MTEEELEKRIAEIKTQLDEPVVYLDQTALEFGLVEMSKNCRWALHQLQEALISLEHTEYWNSCRWERIKEYAKANGFWKDVAAIMANGTIDTLEMPTYAQKYNALLYKKVMAEKERDRLYNIVLTLEQAINNLEEKWKTK